MTQVKTALAQVPWYGFAGTAWFAPAIGAIAIVVVLTAINPDAKAATLWGAIVWLSVWVISGFGYGQFTSPDKANARSYGELTNKLATLQAKRDELCTEPNACAEATNHLRWVADETKVGRGDWRWVNGAGFITIWQRLHRAEEALVRITPKDHLLDEVLYDELRLKDSSIPNRDDLMDVLRSVKKYLADGPGDKSLDPYLQTDKDAASAAAEVRFSIDDFRDSSWNGLLQLRNQTMTTLLLTNIALFAAVAVTVIAGTKGPALLAATIFYIAGAVIGLFSRITAQLQTQAAIEDYGLTNARIVAIPVYSGLAAVAGVMITSVAGAATGVSAGTTAPDLATLFAIPPAIGLLIVAAAFGAAPDLVLSRLADASQKFKTGIVSTEPGSRQ